MRASQATASYQVVTLQLALLICDDNNAKVVCEQIHRVVTWHCDCHLELAGQELCAIDGLRGVLKVGTKAIECAVRGNLGILLVSRSKLLSIKPHIVVCAGLRSQKVGNVIRHLLCYHITWLVLVGSSDACDVSVHITTSSQSRAHVLNDGAEHGFEVLLEHAMQLIGLASGQAQRPVAKIVRQVVHRQVQLVRDSASRLPGPHHEHVGLAGPKGALLAVILLI
mmetsp:Transcript_4857/g.8445  ORF Transcript_4857/g.8445 Transcript_4857/m.8445 type:complete len:224 (+) Transcript_4857:1791-2462(+)